MKKFYLLILLFFAWCSGGFTAQAQTVYPYFPDANVKANLAEVATSVAEPATFVAGLATDFTLEVNGTSGTAIKIANGITAYEYTPATTSKVRFLKKDGVVYVYEDAVYKAIVNPEILLQFPGVRAEADNATNQTGIYSALNLISNPGFETRTTQGTSTTHFKDGTYWDAYNEAKIIDWGTGSTAAIRSLSGYFSEGTYSFVMHGTSRYLTQKLGKLKPNTYYQISYDFWASSPAGTNGGATYNILVGNEQFGGKIATLTGHSTSLTEITRKTFSGVFKTPETLQDADAWLTFHRPISKVDWIDRVSLLETISTTTFSGISGVTGTALYVGGSAYAPEIRLNLAAGDFVEMTQFIVNPSFENAFTGWTNSGMVTQTNTSFGTFKQGTTYAERWVSTPPVPNVSVTQTVTGLPNGKYTLRLAAHNIVQTPLSGKPGAFLFANEAQTEVSERNDYAVEFLVVNGTATIGFKTVSSQGNWAAADNFRLQYKGFSVEQVKSTLQTLKDSAVVVLAKKMQNPVRAMLVSANDAALLALNNATITSDELAGVVVQIQNALKEANTSVLAYTDLQKAIEAANTVYGDGSGREANVLLAAIQKNQTLASNLDASMADLKNGVTELNSAVYAYRMANATGPAPVVTTNTNFARGATMAFGRSTISVPVADLLEHGFCWSTNPEPTVFDNKTTKFFTNNGFIYRLENLQPSTVYYMRAYAISKSYAIGYGDVVKVITIPKGTVTYQLNSSVVNSGEHYPRIASAVESAVNYFNNFTSIQGHRLSVNYNAGTPTAEASYGGYMQFGANPSNQRTGTALHELGHTIGVGQHSMWYGPNSPLRAEGTRGIWLGERANKVVQFLENNPNEVMRGDGVHMWPYGINGANEDTGSELLYIGNALVHQALGEDGLPPTNGFATPAYTFKHTDEEKYYIKVEDKNGGNTFLAENATGQLFNRTLSPTQALANDSAAWYFKFVPATGYYQIRNVATGKHFTYQRTGENGVTLTSVTNPTLVNSFQLMSARYTTMIGEGAMAFPVKAYWIVRPEARLTPPTLAANQNGSTTVVTFENRDAATSQRWLLLSVEDVNSFNRLLSRVPTGVEKPRIASGDNKITLTWEFLYGMKYDILRSETETGTYTTIATNVEALRYEDLNRENDRTYFYKVIAHNVAGRSPESAVLTGTPKDGRHVFVNFNEATGTLAEDFWGGYHATLSPTARREAGPTGQTLKLDGTPEAYASLPEGVVSSLTDFTISTWVKMDALSTWMRVFDFGTGTSRYMFLTVQANVTDGRSTVRYTLRNGSADVEKQVNASYLFPLNTWTHLAITQSGNVASLFINGEKVGTTTDFNLKPADLGMTNQNYIGKSQYNDPMFRGAIDEFRIFNTAVSDSDIRGLANGQPLSSGKDLHSNVVVYPNPASSVIKISGLSGKVYQYSLYNLVGTKVAEGTVQQGQILLPATIANGNYILQLQDNNTTAIRKRILIQK